MPVDPYPGTPAPNTLADATKLRAQLDVLFPDVVRRGKSIIVTEQARTSTTFGTLTTPDEVTGIVMPTDGLIAVAYQARWKEQFTGLANAAIFLNSTQLKAQINNTPSSQATLLGGGTMAADTFVSLATGANGLNSNSNVGAGADDVTTGQVVGQGTLTAFGHGPCFIFAAAGTYTVSVQFRMSSGSGWVTAKNRKLWVWSLTF